MRFDWHTCYTGDCIVWTGALNEHGYGVFGINGRTMLAHRYAYERKRGPIPQGLEPDHICRNPCCVNDGHLEAVTHQVNVQRGNAGTWIRRPKAERELS